MTDNEIIKALECCLGRNGWGDPKCYECPFDGSDPNIGCKKNLLNNALDLINRQKAEIEDKAERLRKVLPIVAELKAEAIKEFAERLKEEFPIGFSEYCAVDIQATVYDIVKEMTGDQHSNIDKIQ